MTQLEALCSRDIWDDEARQWRLDENQFSAALALINSIRPRNEMEACLAAQMVAVHMMQMQTSARALKHKHDIKTAATASKLARTFTMQIEALQALKGKRRSTKQNIVVTKETHQHVHYHDHRGAEETGRQSHGRNAEAPDERKAVRSQEPGGKVVSLSSRAGKSPV
ncbi:hypothetical protein U8326_10025 [Tsuneonella sp. CC-YZS046]|uniref:hypothetical protein n=1 Tax=Tsuneonella sp. CC-YZS046 TaxID=3042152 RepID=UPI002D770DDD|nr:hypothetical protein [Tsuneonella sp. CC-YZS046]WRO65398.1 hypothetical protein U8326_10025 [Tsuneonella sp. CC-YZS046]